MLNSPWMLCCFFKNPNQLSQYLGISSLIPLTECASKSGNILDITCSSRNSWSINIWPAQIGDSLETPMRNTSMEIFGQIATRRRSNPKGLKYRMYLWVTCLQYLYLMTNWAVSGDSLSQPANFLYKSMYFFVFRYFWTAK